MILVLVCLAQSQHRLQLDLTICCRATGEHVFEEKREEPDPGDEEPESYALEFEGYYPTVLPLRPPGAGPEPEQGSPADVLPTDLLNDQANFSQILAPTSSCFAMLKCLQGGIHFAAHWAFKEAPALISVHADSGFVCRKDFCTVHQADLSLKAHVSAVP